MDIHQLLDHQYGEDGLIRLRELVSAGADPNARDASTDETPLHVATRRRRLEAVKELLLMGARIDDKTRHGKTAFAHAIRRRFDEVADHLRTQGANTTLTESDQLAIKIVNCQYASATQWIRQHPCSVRTGNPEEDRLLADVAGRNEPEGVRLLIQAGADLNAPGLDGGTPLHQAAWFGQPTNARQLVDAGADLDRFDNDHRSAALGWAVHGARYSGGAEERLKAYQEVVAILIDAGATQTHPDVPGSGVYLQQLVEQAPESIANFLRSLD